MPQPTAFTELLSLVFAKILDGFSTLSPCDYCHRHDEQDIPQMVAAPPWITRIRK